MFKPAGDRLLVEVQKPEEKTASGLILSAGENQSETRLAKVVAVGPGKWSDKGETGGYYVPIEYEEGNMILLNRYGGTKYSTTDESLLIIKEEEILGRF